MTGSEELVFRLELKIPINGTDPSQALIYSYQLNIIRKKKSFPLLGGSTRPTLKCRGWSMENFDSTVGFDFLTFRPGPPPIINVKSLIQYFYFVFSGML